MLAGSNHIRSPFIFVDHLGPPHKARSGSWHLHSCKLRIDLDCYWNAPGLLLGQACPSAMMLDCRTVTGLSPDCYRTATGQLHNCCWTATGHFLDCF